MSHPKPGNRDGFLFELKEMILEDWLGIMHGLWCPTCEMRGQALAALALAEMTEAEFFEAVRVKLTGASGGQ